MNNQTKFIVASAGGIFLTLLPIPIFTLIIAEILICAYLVKSTLEYKRSNLPTNWAKLSSEEKVKVLDGSKYIKSAGKIRNKKKEIKVMCKKVCVDLARDLSRGMVVRVNEETFRVSTIFDCICGLFSKRFCNWSGYNHPWNSLDTAILCIKELPDAIKETQTKLDSKLKEVETVMEELKNG